jgi:hypothetical protein
VTILRASSALFAATLAIGVLAGCVPGAEPEPSATASLLPGESASPSAEPTPTPTATIESDPGATPFSVPCETLASLQTMYDFNPNFALTGSFSPSAGTPAADAAADQGTLCRWVNATSGEAIDFTASIPSPAQFEARKAAAASGTPVTGLGADAWFTSEHDVGTVQVFKGDKWVTVSSAWFTLAQDAQALVTEAVNAVG